MLRFHLARPVSFVLLAGAIAAAVGLARDVRAADACTPLVARVVSVQGSVEFRRSRATNWQTAQQDETLCAGDAVRVGEHGRAALVLANETTLRLDQNSAATLAAPDNSDSSLLNLARGVIHVITRTPKPFKVTTPFANAGVEGTEFLVGVDAEGAKLAAYEGHVSVSNEFGMANLFAGEFALVAKDIAPRVERKLRPVNDVQWALYYPNVMDLQQDEKGGTPPEPGLRKSIEHYRQGQLAEAIFLSDKLAKVSVDPRTLTYRAGLLLLVGRVDEAKPALDRALTLDSRYGDAYALQAVIAVVQNDKDKALQLATRAVELDGASPTAHMALSYAEQAHARIDRALASALKAADLHPAYALGWARVAELYMATGELEDAQSAAQRAAILDPKLARTHAVLGFAQLTRMDTGAAKLAFKKAIALDQADPLPRLGLGLAEIRDGDLAAGREEIEIAVCLDPGNSLIRSYMGKTYYEERRNALAAQQFDLAKSLDPRDPTPWFYDAVRLQSENRPVEALADLRKSEELNDNRAVYRSRLLLDEDIAARNASQARIYRSLGFDRLAQIQAYSSLDADPSNFSAHRLLADAYLAQPRHEVARVSELLQSQLMQPANLAPLQPQFAESDFFLLEQGGLRNPSFNEYSPLFQRDRLSLQASAIGGSRDTLGADASVSGINGRFSFSLAASRFDTDGIRANDDLRQETHGLLVQGTLTPETSIQAEYRDAKSWNGDRTLNFDPNQFSPTQREDRKSEYYRIGFRHDFTPASQLIGSWSYRDFKYRNRDQTTIDVSGAALTASTDTNARQRGTLAELQHLWRLDRWHLVTGGGVYRADDDTSVLKVTHIPALQLLREVFPGVFFPVQVAARTETSTTMNSGVIRQSNLYSYSTLHAGDRAQLTLGLSADAFKEESTGVERNQLNPKFGLVWKPADNTTLRFAGFRTLKRALTGNQTLEPTQVAGFTQFFDDVNGTEARGAGAAIDQSFGSYLLAGLAVSGRNLHVPTTTADATWRERGGDAYLYWLPTARVAARAGVNYLNFDRGDDPRFNNFLNLRTLKTPLSLAYFEPSGLSARITATYVRQNGTFLAATPNSPSFSGKSNFWVADLNLGMLLPKRYGSFGVSVLNMFDRNFNFHQNIDPTKPSQREFEPGRRIFFGFNLAL